VLFDITNSQISFVDANCDTITPQTSHLTDAYTFAPCPPAGSAAAQPPPRNLSAAATPTGSSWLANQARAIASAAGFGNAADARRATAGRTVAAAKPPQKQKAAINRSGGIADGRTTLRSVMRSNGNAPLAKAGGAAKHGGK
jgi:hypothetical protein